VLRGINPEDCILNWRAIGDRSLEKRVPAASVAPSKPAKYEKASELVTELVRCLWDVPMVGESRKKVSPPILLDALADESDAAHCAVCATRGVISAKNESGVINTHCSSGVRGSAGEGGDDGSISLLALTELQSENWLRNVGREGFGSSLTSRSGVAGAEASLLSPSVRSVSGAALLSRVCVNVKMPSAYAFKTGLCTTRRGEMGEVGTSCGGGSFADGGNVDASGVGSTSSISSSTGERGGVGLACNVLTESLRWTWRSGDLPKPSLEGVLKLNDLAGNDSWS